MLQTKPAFPDRLLQQVEDFLVDWELVELFFVVVRSPALGALELGTREELLLDAVRAKGVAAIGENSGLIFGSLESILALLALKVIHDSIIFEFLFCSYFVN